MLISPGWFHLEGVSFVLISLLGSCSPWSFWVVLSMYLGFPSFVLFLVMTPPKVNGAHDSHLYFLPVALVWRFDWRNRNMNTGSGILIQKPTLRFFWIAKTYPLAVEGSPATPFPWLWWHLLLICKIGVTSCHRQEIWIYGWVDGWIDWLKCNQPSI